MAANIHPTALIEDGAEIGDGTRIWVNVQVRSGARIDKDCNIGKDVFVDEGVIIGPGCKIQNGVSIYRGVSLAGHVFIGPNACFTNDRLPRAFNEAWQVVPTRVDEGASIGANATIVCGVTIGEYAMVAAGAVVTRDVPPFTLVRGNPARSVAQIDRLGHKIEGS